MATQIVAAAQARLGVREAGDAALLRQYRLTEQGPTPVERAVPTVERPPAATWLAPAPVAPRCSGAGERERER